MRVAICDDSLADAKAVEFALMGLDCHMDIELFATGESLLARAREGMRFDCAYLDVYLDGENGVDVARKLAAISPATQVVFCTTSADHAVDAFRVRAVDYIVKPFTELDVVRSFARLRAGGEREGRVLLRVGGDLCAVRPREAASIVADRHYVEVSLYGGRRMRAHMNFSDALSAFGPSFVEVKRGLAVNMDHVDRVSGSAVTLADGREFTMSRARKNDVVAAYVRHINEASASMRPRA